MKKRRKQLDVRKISVSSGTGTINDYMSWILVKDIPSIGHKYRVNELKEKHSNEYKKEQFTWPKEVKDWIMKEGLRKGEDRECLKIINRG